MLIKNGSTAQNILFFMTDSADHITGKTGLTPTVTISKNGGAFASPSGAVSAVGNGWYQVAGNATDSGTNGPLLLHATSAGADPCDLFVGQVVPFDPLDAVRLGLTSLPNVNIGSAGGLVATGTGANQLNVSGGRADANVLYWEGADLTAAGVFQRLGIVDQGTAQAATNTTVQLRAASPFGADSTDIGMTLLVFGSSQGYWQARAINSYVGSTKTATVDAFAVTPTGTITYLLVPTAPYSNAAPLNANISQINGVAASATNLQKMTDGTGGVALSANLSGNITGSVASVTNPVTVGTNNDKTGYAVTNVAGHQLQDNGVGTKNIGATS
jgi:hypothetical protein